MKILRHLGWVSMAVAASVWIFNRPTAFAEAAPSPSFKSAPSGEFTFDTGTLRGVLRTQGKSLGLSSVVHTPTGQRLDRSNGLLSHYRVFTRGVRYGGGAWDWPSTARLADNGTVEVVWASAEDHPFEMRATYRWLHASTIELVTSVKARKDLKGFESFLANYFSEAFTNCSVLVKTPAGASDSGQFIPALKTSGDWLMFPRDAEAIKLIKDGRWKLEPNPVDWVIMPEYKRPTAFRRAPGSGVTVVLASQPSDCFALATPHQSEGHYSLYLSLFGKDLKAGQEVRAVARMFVTTELSEKELIKTDTEAGHEGPARDGRAVGN